ncbi:helix-turn-helix domain-containing protein [Kribbella solani]|uniref:DNA-binding IclR family transcriptional regulator n=1 Tax=Kribbella solani TaxID=236067 RepID=A0A841DU83_9ACTN|nr:helix-turn-helix domain-containing protein [Kribbella solani]MBB5980290.1 DNA-binding IclR family transcriptional regulator [Kribbella solani]MDX2973144.1 helix-turn-helix domain-containing protein [Kribbella solani]MDX3004533.1 helix-turn-helix domain-containing protein [Kribbella solani]
MQSLSRALTVLAELNREDRAYGVTELAVTVGLHKSTVHRILATFCAHGLADRVGDHRYTARDGLSALRRTTDRRPGSEHALAALGNRLGRLVVLAKPLPKSTGTVLQITAVADGAGAPVIRPGHAVSLHRSALGRAYLSALPVDQVSGTPDLLDTLQRIRLSGFAHNARPVASLPRMVAVPVRARDGSCAGALGAELIQPGSIDELRRVVSVLRSGV